MKNWILGICTLSGSLTALGQSVSGGNFSGNMEATFQYLNADTLIDATQPDSKGLLNSYMNVFYTHGNFKAGMRVESYLPRIQGYPNRFDGTGIGMRYVGYANDYVDVTLGHFYEQFGSGMALRAYEDRNLGYDNAIDGARVILRPYKGVQIKGVYGFQRYSFQSGRVINSDGITRGVDAQVHLNDLFHGLDSTGLDITLGGSLVSKYQKDDNETYVLPENVGAYGGRVDIRYKKFYMNGEYILKENDPSSDNGYIYNNGHAALVNMGYSQKGLGILFSAKSVENMSFRSDRTKDLQDLFINYLPALNKTHTYNLVATLYPYATQPLGEVALQGEVLYTIPKGVLGKYAVPINVNYSTAYMPVRSYDGFDPTDTTRVMYESNPFDKSDSLLWEDFNVNITYKFNKKFYVIGSYYRIRINNDVAKVTPDAHGVIKTHIGVLEMGYKINSKHNIRMELQGLFNANVYEEHDGKFDLVREDKGNWATAVIEYTISPNWFFGVIDQWNYGNRNEDLRIHYITGSFGWIKEATRLTINYGRQRAGLFCVGGVCRFVPASNGLTISFTQSF
jgi:hypothetical protein